MGKSFFLMLLGIGLTIGVLYLMRDERFFPLVIILIIVTAVGTTVIGLGDPQKKNRRNAGGKNWGKILFFAYVAFVLVSLIAVYSMSGKASTVGGAVIIIVTSFFAGCGAGEMFSQSKE